MTGSTSKKSLPTCAGFYGTEIKIQNTNTNTNNKRLYKSCTLFDTAFYTLYLVLWKHFLIYSLVSQIENCYLQHIFHLVDTGFLKSELFMSGNIQKPLGLSQMSQGQD